MLVSGYRSNCSIVSGSKCSRRINRPLWPYTYSYPSFTIGLLAVPGSPSLRSFTSLLTPALASLAGDIPGLLYLLPLRTTSLYGIAFLTLPFALIIAIQRWSCQKDGGQRLSRLRGSGQYAGFSAADAVRRCRHNAAGISGAFAAWIQSRCIDRLQICRIA